MVAVDNNHGGQGRLFGFGVFGSMGYAKHGKGQGGSGQ